MKKIAIVVVLVGIALVLIMRPSKQKSHNEAGDEVEMQDDEVSMFPPKPAPTPIDVSSENTVVAPTEQQTNSADAQVFHQQMAELSRCLGVSTNQQVENAGPTFFALNEALQNILGPSVSEVESWNSVDIRTASGELRRIVIENSGGDSGHGKTLQYFKVGENEALQELPLSEEQSLNPSDSLIATLESDGDVQTRTVARQVYYDGTIIYMLEKDGRLQSYEVRRDGKVFLCRTDQVCLCE